MRLIAALVLALATGLAHAQACPAKPIHPITPFPHLQAGIDIPTFARVSCAGAEEARIKAE